MNKWEQFKEKKMVLSIVSLVVGLVSIVLAVFSMAITSKTEKRIIKICKSIKN